MYSAEYCLNLKTKIRRCFNRAKHTYDLNADLQQTICKQLIAEVSTHHQYFPNIIDIGCGTGLSTQFLKNAFQCQQLMAIDLADDLLSLAQTRSMTTVCADFDQIPTLSQQFDLVFANMSLQWSENLSATLAEISRVTKHSGLLAVSLPICGTFGELKHLLYQMTGSLYFNEFIPLETLSTVLKNSDYQIITLQTTDHYFTQPDLKSALRSLKSVGALAHTCRNTLTKSIYQKILSISPNLNYHIAQFVAQKF